jgi:hypothetical protein
MEMSSGWWWWAAKLRCSFLGVLGYELPERGGKCLRGFPSVACAGMQPQLLR